MTSTGAARVVGPFRLRSPLPAWGFGWHVAVPAVDDSELELPPLSVVRTAWEGEMPLQVALEGAARGRWHHPNVPRLLRRGDDQGTSWMCFEAVAAVRVEALLASPVVEPVPVAMALALAVEIAGALRALDGARRADEKSAIGMRLSEILVTSAGHALVVTPPPGTRMMRPGLLAQTAREPLLVAPELLRGDVTLTHGAVDMYAAGAALSLLLFPDGRTDELAAALPRRVLDVVERAMLDEAHERFESWDELIRALDAAADDFPPVEDEERRRLVVSRASRSIEDARRALL